MTEMPSFLLALEILSEMVQLNSVNPGLVPGGEGEGRMAKYLCNLLRSGGIPTELHEVAPGRFNVVASIRGTRPGPRVLLNGHMDTVGVEGMTAPFSPVPDNGRIYGRGTQDMKSGIAAGVAALLELSGNPDCFCGEVVLSAVADEEDKSIGTQSFLANYHTGHPFDFALVMEPTDLKVCTSHKGFVWLEVHTQGIAAHGSRPEEGVDAIRAMGAVLQELELLDARLQSRPTHPLLGSGSLHASLIHGGREWSSYPDHCCLKYERRTIPGESDLLIGEELQELLIRLKERIPRFEASGSIIYSRTPFETSPDLSCHQAFFNAAHDLFPDLVAWGAVSFWTDAALLAEAGIPTLIFGPRGAGLHSINEYVIASDVTACAQVVYSFISRFCQ
jgi:acetylornithine deacetylase